MPTSSRWIVAVKHGIDVNLTRADPATGRIDLARAPRKTSDFDKNAVEEAVRLREKHGGTVTALAVGPATAREAIRDALSMGADEGVLLTIPDGNLADSRATAASLAAYLRTPEVTFDLALFGEGSTDHFSQTVGPRVAAELGIPSLCHVRQLEVDGDHLRASRDLETTVEQIETGFPAVVTVGQEINTPRLPTFLTSLKASKKEIREIPVSSLNVAPSAWSRSVTVREASVPIIPRRKLRVSGSDAASISQELVSILQREGIGRV